MTLSAVIRRAATSAAPAAALLSISKSRPVSHLHTLLQRSISHAEFPSRRTSRSSAARDRWVSTAAQKSGGAADLLEVIDFEIKCSVESDDHGRVEEIPKGFPFEIEDKPSMNTVTLKRNYEAECVEIIVTMPSLVSGADPEPQGKAEGTDGEGRIEKPSQQSLPLIVNVTKPGGVTLEFCCTAYPDEVTIDSLSVKKNDGPEDDLLAYEGPAFNDLDENLQRAFHKYLDLRGISPLNTNFLHEYMINKDSREYLLWLNKLKQFVLK